jgi:RNA recognition motif-containing protein
MPLSLSWMCGKFCPGHWCQGRRNPGKMEVKLYVGNLSFSTTEDTLRTLFAQAGTVVDVALIKDRDTGSSKGFAFITMSTQAEAEAAIKKYNGYMLENRELRVNPARPKEEGGRGGFGPRGGDNYGRGGPGGNRRGGGGGQRRY